MSLFKANVPPSRVPTLTEVVEVHGALTEEVMPAESPAGVGALAALTATPTTTASSPPQSVNPDLLTQQVMTDIQRQIDAMLEVRLKEALAPIVTRLTDALARDARSELTKVMKDVVSRCVAEEVRRAQSKR
ncbi:MAG: hypothetical protein RIS44_624 [Pseudomonadota bacterium]|jgi:hypothetical protein